MYWFVCSWIESLKSWNEVQWCHYRGGSSEGQTSFLDDGGRYFENLVKLNRRGKEIVLSARREDPASQLVN